MFFNGLVIFTFLIFNHFCEGRWRRNISSAYVCWKGLSVSGQDTHGEAQNHSYVSYLLLNQGQLSISLKPKLCWCWGSPNANIRFYCSEPQTSNALEGSRSCQRNPAQHLPKRYLCNSCFSHELGKSLAVQGTLSESWFQEGRLVLRPKSRRSWCFWWWRCDTPSVHLLWVGTTWTTQVSWCAQPCTSDCSSCNFFDSSFTLVCEPVNSLVCLRKQRQNPSCPCAADFDTKKVLTKWILLSAFCVCEKFRHLWSFSNWVRKCCKMNTSKPKKSGEGRERMLIFSSAYRWPSEDKHGKKSQGEETAQKKME